MASGSGSALTTPGQRLLVLNPFDAGSHRAFFSGWQKQSRHTFTVLCLPGRSWKWRMRHAAVTFAEQLRQRHAPDEWDALVTTDMLNLAEFRGLAPRRITELPAVLYFHENQFAYPSRLSGAAAERDRHFALTNYVSAIAADAVWFNSSYNRESFLNGAMSFLSHMPPEGTHEPHLDRLLKTIRCKSSIHYPGIAPIHQAFARDDGPLHILWAARWEHDKNPDQFFEAIRQLQDENTEFRLSVIGESYRNEPDCFADAKLRFQSQLENWGYAESRDRYEQVLASADVIVSTAVHEFFGISVVEAMSTGCVPVLPNRLSYPELVQQQPDFLYAGTTATLVDRLRTLAHLKRTAPSALNELRNVSQSLATRFLWASTATKMDEAIGQLHRG